MANLANINDDVLRKQFEEARSHMQARKPTDAVHTLVDAFMGMVERNPALLQATTAGRRGQVSILMSWPQLGAGFEPGTLQAGAPKPRFTKDTFALSEAITYYEFIVDLAVKQGL